MLNADYYDAGIRLLVEHLGVRTEFHGMRETAGYFWQELALKLLQRHVPYFMEPGQRGAPSTLQSLFPMLEMLVQGIKQGDAMAMIRADHAKFAREMGIPPREIAPVKWTVDRAYREIAKLARCKQETVEREFGKWRGKRTRGNSAQ